MTKHLRFQFQISIYKAFDFGLAHVQAVLLQDDHFAVVFYFDLEDFEPGQFILQIDFLQ